MIIEKICFAYENGIKHICKSELLIYIILGLAVIGFCLLLLALIIKLYVPRD